MAPRLAAGTELIGEYQGSGFQEPRYLLRRPDGQVIQLPHLLYLLVACLDGQRDLSQVATVLSAEFGKEVQPRQVSYLIDDRLRPAGIVTVDKRGAEAGVPAKAPVKSDPLLALKSGSALCPSGSCGASPGSSGRCSGPQRSWPRWPASSASTC